MSLIDLFKKSSSSPAPSPITKFDEKLPPLPPPPAPVAPKMPSLPPLPKVEARPIPPAPTLPPLPKIEPLKAPPAPKPAPLPPAPQPKFEIPKISVEQPKAAPPMSAPLPSAPAAKPEAPKLENSRLAKALEELTSVDFDLDEPKSAPKVEVKPAPQPFVMKAAPLPPAGPKQKFIAMPVFDNTLRELKQVQQDLMETQANNERLGMLENQKKNSYEMIVTGFEQVQRQLLAIDEKLFKVN